MFDFGFRLGTSVRICDPDHSWCGYFGNIVSMGWAEGCEWAYVIQYDASHPCITATGTQVEPN